MLPILDEQEVVRLYKSGMSARQVGNVLGVGGHRVLRICRKYKIVRNKSEALWASWGVALPSKEEEDLIVQSYLSGMSAAEVAEKFNRLPSTIGTICRKKGIMREQEEYIRLAKGTEINDNAFDILTPEALYWLGFFAADGCVAKNGRKFSLGLASRDVEHIEKFVRFLGARNNIRTWDTKRISKKGEPILKSCYSGSSKHIVDRMYSVGITQRKSLTFDPVKELTDSRDFWRGMIDGDGYLGIYNTRNAKNIPVIKLVGSYPSVEKFLHFVKNNCVDTGAVVHDKGNIGSSMFSHNKARKIVRLLYKDATVYLDRKYEIAKQIMAQRCKDNA